MARPFDTYSKRNSLMTDVFTYDSISRKLRNQIYHIWNDFFYKNRFDETLIKQARERIFNIICSEEGVKSLYLTGHFINSHASQVDSYFESLEDTDKILDTIEIIFHEMLFVAQIHSEKYNQTPPIRYNFKLCVSDLNKRFLENGVGYQYESGKVVKISTTHLKNTLS
jgi:hypothetical protein